MLTFRNLTYFYSPPGAIICGEGPPTPLAGPCKPGPPEAPGPEIPRPAARPIPCPGAAPANGTLATPSLKNTKDNAIIVNFIRAW